MRNKEKKDLDVASLKTILSFTNSKIRR